MLSDPTLHIVAPKAAAPRPAKNWRRDEPAESQAGQLWNSMGLLPVFCRYVFS
jgi:hypothetical protein